MIVNNTVESYYNDLIIVNDCDKRGISLNTLKNLIGFMVYLTSNAKETLT